MCIVLSPASFLAVAFHESKKEDLDYGWLNAYRSSMRAIKSVDGPVDVSWDHDSVNYTMGYFSPVFSTSKKGVHCNLKNLELYYEDMTQDVDKCLLESVQNCARLCGKNAGRKVANVRRKSH